ncbi:MULTISPECIES: type VI secretion system baseplate subunit TssG [unclassified Francisella]|uniref:type VI secretion system baseplate subunit TssG n=1 Tax=unclassified Francisella TaxID=2610885 RepID=UPI002E30B15E|nr:MULTISPECIES: type VI secretion system baseplate subunit TssG [unclassified Francisella]MED7818340.1 type VI secretion system baseplate subunit TssG [Francisella sp. 19S2-4]MED7829176.1 type VI secretion system baseplate subunit TssG [Francisella sp. 19S2-10]
MASNDEQRIFREIELFVSNSYNYNFYQAIRWLNGISGIAKKIGMPVLDIKVTPHLSLEFAGNDIKSMSFDKSKYQIDIVVTFMGLYGTVSPLPTFYTENLIVEVNDSVTVNKDFLDIFHQVFYKKIYSIWLKYKLNLMTYENKSSSYIEKTYSLVGLGDQTLRRLVPNSISLVRYAGLFSKRSRSLKGLQIMLRDYFNLDMQVSNFKTLQYLSDDQYVNLGCKNSSLGRDLYLGRYVKDFFSSIKIDILDISAKDLASFNYGGENIRKLGFLVKFYCYSRVRCFVRLHISKEELKKTQKELVLGVNSWFDSQENEFYKTKYFMI